MTARNRADLRLYAQGWLGGSGRPAAEVEALIDAIDARADGSFIYLRMLREAHENRGLPLDKDSLPDGLNGLYDEWFRRQFPDAGHYRTRVAPLLALILAAETPVPEAVLDEAMAGRRTAGTRSPPRRRCNRSAACSKSAAAAGRRFTRVCGTG